MSRKRLLAVLTVGAALVILLGCQTPQVRTSVRAAPEEERVSNGALGAYLDSKIQESQDTNVTYKYLPTQGLRLDVSSVRMQPPTIYQGEKVDVKAVYAVMAPSDERVVLLTERRVATLNRETLLDISVSIERNPGLYSSIVPVQLPSNAARGTYEVTVTVSAEGRTASRSATFIVQ